MPTKANYADYREELRLDFWYSCAYCTMTEVEAMGLGFQIDHYQPKSQFPQLATTYSNLFWACQRCNRDKSDYWPTPAQLAKQLLVIRPDQDDPRRHLRLDGEVLAGITTTGKFHIARLGLNRQVMRRIRSIRARMWRSEAFMAHGFTALLSIRLDELPQESRSELLALRKRVSVAIEELDAGIEEFVRAVCRSHVLDPDPEDAKSRRAQLRECDALTPDSLRAIAARRPKRR